MDHHLSPHIAAALRHRGVDVVAAKERGWRELDDEALLERCAADSRALVTNDLGDFAVIARRWAADGRVHAGLILVPRTSFSSRRAGIGRYVAALGALLATYPADDALRDRVEWLRVADD